MQAIDERTKECDFRNHIVAHNILVHVSDMLAVAKKRGLIATMHEIDWIKILACIAMPIG